MSGMEKKMEELTRNIESLGRAVADAENALDAAEAWLSVAIPELRESRQS